MCGRVHNTRETNRGEKGSAGVCGKGAITDKGQGKRGRRNSSSPAHRGEGTGDHMKEGHVGSGI